METAYQRFTQETWRRFIQNKQPLEGYRYHKLSLEPVTQTPPQVRKAWTEGSSVVMHARDESPDSDADSIIAVPMKVRGQVIGVINLRIASGQINEETSTLIEDVANRLSLVLENARLVESAQSRVEREQFASEISNKMSGSLDMDTVVRTVVEELGNNLDLDEIEVRIGQPSDSPAPGKHNGKNNSRGNTDSGSEV